MNIAVIGLGLIGGSFCKAISKRTTHTCFGFDMDTNTIQKAKEQYAIINSIKLNELSNMDMVIVCLHPKQSIDFILKNIANLKKGSIIIDSCGVKESIINAVDDILTQNNINFLGCHPMAGREFSGFDYSLESLFDNASFIMTKTNNTSQNTIEIVEDLANEIGFKKLVVTTPQEHDRVIAFTSQLAHVVSNAYIKSPTLKSEAGFSAGSFLDLTRVAKLNPDMWTDLFLMNDNALCFEIQAIIDHLQEYKTALQSQNHDHLKELLKNGSDLKEQSLKN